MTAAVRDHGGGEYSRRGMVISRGSEIATPVEQTLQAAPIGMEQQTPIVAPHHAKPEADEADRTIPQIMAFPTALEDTVGAEEGLRDLAVGCLLVMSVERAQGKDELVSAMLGQLAGIGTWIAACQATIEAKRSGGTDLEKLVEWQKDSGRFYSGCVDVDAKHHAMPFDDVFDPFVCGDGIEKAWWMLVIRIGEISRKPRQGDHAWQSVRRP